MGDGRAAASMEPATAVAANTAMDTEALGIVETAPARSLKIMHILRAPLGGLFRHVVDVARGQAERGHRIGLIVDSTTGGPQANAALAELAPHLALGLQRVALLRVNSRYGRFGVLKFKDVSRRMGHPVVIEQKWMPGDTDFKRQLRIINESRVDAIVIWGDGPQAGLVELVGRAKLEFLGNHRTVPPGTVPLPLAVRLGAAWIARHKRSGASGISSSQRSSSGSAFSTALQIAPRMPDTPDSPTPLVPSGVNGERVS